MKSFSCARSRYVAYLEDQRKEQEEARKNSEKEKKESSSKHKEQDKLVKYTADNDILNSGIVVTEKAISEASAELSTIMKSGKIDRAKLHLCKSQVEMEIKRKEELT